MDKYDKIFSAAQDVITDNLTHVDEAVIWLVGSAVENGSIAHDRLVIFARLTFDTGEVGKFDFTIPENMMEELDTVEAVFGYAVECLINHLILPQYFAKIKT